MGFVVGGCAWCSVGAVDLGVVLVKAILIFCVIWVAIVRIFRGPEPTDRCK